MLTRGDASLLHEMETNVKKGFHKSRAPLFLYTPSLSLSHIQELDVTIFAHPRVGHTSMGREEKKEMGFLEKKINKDCMLIFLRREL